MIDPLSSWHRQVLIKLAILCIVMFSLFGFFIYWVVNHPTHDHHRCPVPGCEYNQKAGN